MNDEIKTESGTQPQTAVGSSDWLDVLERFLEAHGDSYLSWRDGCVVIETYYEKRFRALGGDPLRMPAYFEDYGNMHDASRHYIEDLRSASDESTATRLSS